MEDSHSCTVNGFVFSDRNTDSEMTVMCNGIRTTIAITAKNLEKSPTAQNQYLHFLRVAEAGELDGLTVDDLYDWILEGCATDLLQLPRPTYPTTPTLEHYLHPETVHFTLHAAEDNQLSLLRSVNASSEEVPFGARVNTELCASWPAYEASQVEIVAESSEQALSQTPRKVIANGRAYFFKAYRRRDSGTATHELRRYAEIREAGLDDLQISRLFGLVHDSAGMVLGLLLSYIEAKAVTLSCALRPGTSPSLRQRWADQITSTLTRLHEAGIIWGDVKPDNVLIDVQNNTWIIDFGGGYTEGWVDQDLAGTLQGDRQGLSRMIEWIHS